MAFHQDQRTTPRKWLQTLYCPPKGDPKRGIGPWNLLIAHLLGIDCQVTKRSPTGDQQQFGDAEPPFNLTFFPTRKAKGAGGADPKAVAASRGSRAVLPLTQESRWAPGIIFDPMAWDCPNVTNM